MKLLAALVFSLLALPVLAQPYPAKPVRIIVPFAPGGVLGIELGVKSPADGYTLTLIASSYTVNPSIYKLNFDPLADYTAIIQMSQGPLLVVVHPSVPAKSVRELIALAKAKPGDLNYTSSGQGSIIHLATEQFNSMAGTRMNHVPCSTSRAASPRAKSPPASCSARSRFPPAFSMRRA